MKRFVFGWTGILLLFFPMLILLNGCGSTSGGHTITSVTVSPTAASVEIGSTQTFTAVAKDSSNNTVSTSFTWAVTGGVGSVTSGGVFSATTAGTGHVRATAGGITGEADVTVTPVGGQIASIVVTPATAAMRVGEAKAFTAVALDINSNPVAATFAWSVNGGIGSVTPEGVFTAATVGTGEVQAMASGIVGHADTTVSAAFPVSAQSAAGLMGTSMMVWTKSTDPMIPTQIISGFSSASGDRRVSEYVNGWWHVVEVSAGLHMNIDFYYQFWDHSGNNLSHSTTAANVDIMKTHGKFNYTVSSYEYGQTYGNGSDDPMIFEGFSPGEQFVISGPLTSTFSTGGHTVSLALDFADVTLTHNTHYPSSGTVTAILTYDDSVTYTGTITFDGDATAVVMITGYGSFIINLDTGAVS